MSIESEILRLESNVSNSLDALAEQGVNIPADANSNNLPELIRETGNKVNVSDIVDNLTTADATKPLSANQGVVIAEAVDTAKQACLDEVEALEDSILNENGIIKQSTLPEGYPYAVIGNIVSVVTPIDSGSLMGPIAGNFNLTSGASYTVTWNSVEYNCIAEDTVLEGVLPCVGLGDTGASSGQEPTGEFPFSILYMGEAGESLLGVPGIVFALDGSQVATISIDGSIIHKIDKAFLPDTSKLKNLVDGSTPGSIRALYANLESDEYSMGDGAIAFGIQTTASGECSNAEGIQTVASGYSAHAEGQNTTASGDRSHAEGEDTTASGPYAHTEGLGTTASGNSSHAEGTGATASGECSHAEGSQTTASGIDSHAEGWNTTARGSWSHAEGRDTIASGDIQHVQGKYNIVDASSKYAHIVGNGKNGSPSNAHTLDWNGNAWFQGEVKIGGTGQDDENAKTLATTDYVDAKMGETDISVSLDEHNMDTTAHADIREKIDIINNVIGTDDSILGTWVFNDEIDFGTFKEMSPINISFVCDAVQFEQLGTAGTGPEFFGAFSLMYAEKADDFMSSTISVYIYDPNSNMGGSRWQKEEYKTIEILEEPTDETFITWLKNNATKPPGAIIERLDKLDAALDSKVSTFTVETDPMTTMRKIITTIEEEGGDITALNVVNLKGYLGSTLEIRFSHAGASRYNISCALPLEAAAIGKNNFDVDTTTIKSYLSSAISFEEAVSKQTYVSYNELVDLRDNSQLIPGMFYRIYNYVCTTIQENTRAMTNQFDIIVQALSNNTLSENASVDYHWDDNGPDGYFAKLESSFRLDPLFDINEDETGTSDGEPYRTEDVFIAYDYAENPDGDTVPVLYKTNINDYPDEPDYGDVFYYVGTYELDGTTYDRWRKIDAASDNAEYTWNGTVKKYVLTDVVIDNGVFIDSIVNSEGTVKYLVNLPAWELKYSLDNDTTRFAWADEANGRGVVYWMKDEHNNECPYDFKNIQFKRDYDWQNEHSDFIDSLGISESGVEWFYTFSWINGKSEVEDLTLRQDLLTDDPMRYGTHNNKIKTYLYEDEIGAICLNNILMINSYHPNFGLFYGCYSNTFGNHCHFNTFGDSCRNNTFGNNCYSNTFGNNCHSNTFGNDCTSNTFNNDYTSNTFGDSCNSNTFGNNCYNNTFGNYCTSNTFGDDCHDNTFGSGCSYNTFGNDYYNNTFGNHCYYNTFGDDCNSNTFGNDYGSNTFGNHCYYNTFGNYCDSNTFGSYCDNITLGNECHNITSEDADGNPISYMSNIYYANKCAFIRLMGSGGTGDASNYVQNITVSAGIVGTSDHLELQVSRNAPPVVYEAAGTTHIILD